MTSLSGGFQKCSQYLRGVRGYSDATLSNYERTWSQFLGYLREEGYTDEARHFTADTVMGFCDWLAAKGAVPNTILNKIHGLSTLARFLMKTKDGRGKPILTSNPTLEFERPKQTQVETKFLLPDELAQLMAAPADEGLALARAVMLDTGIRCWEAVQANVGDLRQIGDTWYLALAVKGRRQVGAERATIPLSSACADLLTSRRTHAQADEPLFTDRTGRRFTRGQLTSAMIRLGERAGIRRITTSPHRLRHTANVVARHAGVDALTRASMLNHRSLRTLARYDHLVPGEVVKGREQQRAGLETYLSQRTVPQATEKGSPEGHCEAPLRLTTPNPVPNIAE